MSLLAICPVRAGDGERTEEVATGEKTEALPLSATGVEAPDWLGEPVGRAVVAEKMLDSEALLRR